MAAGVVSMVSAFAAEAVRSKVAGPDGVKRFEFGADGTFTFRMVADMGHVARCRAHGGLPDTLLRACFGEVIFP